MRKHPVPKNPAERDTFDQKYACAIVPTAIEFVEKHALYVNGDAEEKPTAEQWQAFFAAIAPGDVFMLAVVVAELHNRTGEQSLGDLVKA